MFIMAQIIPIRDLKNTTAVSQKCKETDEPIFITKNGYGDMVLMNIDVYNRTIAKLDLYSKLKEAEDELNKNVSVVSAIDFVKGLKTKYEKI